MARPPTLRLAGQVLAVGLVTGLLALLVWRVAHGTGGSVAAALAHGREPPAPNFTLRRLDGHGTVSLASLRGRPAVLDFFASWCQPCIHESKRLEAARERYGTRVVFLGVDTHDDSGEARAWLRRHGIRYPSVHDRDGKVLTRWVGGVSLPSIFFVDRSGKVVGQLVVEQDLGRYLKRIATS